MIIDSENISGTMKIAFLSFPCCPQTIQRAEHILADIVIAGHNMVDTTSDADVVIINACSSDLHIHEELQDIMSATAHTVPIIITGCLTNQVCEIITNNDDARQILILNSDESYDTIITVLREFIPSLEHYDAYDALPPHGIKITPPHYAYVALTDNYSGYQSCVSPPCTNNYSHPLRTAASVIEEVRSLIEADIREIILITADSDTNEYRQLIETIKEIANIMYVHETWLRLDTMTTPTIVTDLMPLITEGKILPYVSLVLHDIHNEAHDELTTTIQQWRENQADIAIQAHVFYDEQKSEQYPQELSSFVEQAQFRRLSLAANNKALEKLRQRGQQLTEQELHNAIGSIQPVIIDDLIEDDEIHNIALGRTIYDAPQYDGIVQIEDIYGAQPGQVVHVEIIDATDNDLIAVPA